MKKIIREFLKSIGHEDKTEMLCDEIAEYLKKDLIDMSKLPKFDVVSPTYYEGVNKVLETLIEELKE